MYKIFIYGQLRTGMYFHDEFLGKGQSTFLGKAHTGKDYSLYIEALPSMVKETSETGVKGELFEVNDEVLERLDKLENHPEVYKRELITIYTDKGEEVKAFAFIRPMGYKGQRFSYKCDEFL